MRLKMEDCLLYAVTDTAWLRGQTLAQQVEAALRGGVTMVQLREKALSGQPLEEEAREILALCRRYGVPLLINDDVLLAKKIGADGVHVGQSDMAAAEARRILGPDAIIGVTARTVEQALEAEAAGADYLGSGAVFGTVTKKDARPMEPSYFQKICESVSIPVVAIGGITLDNIRRLEGRKMAGFAIVSGIFAAGDIEKTAGDLFMAARELCLPRAAQRLREKVQADRPVVQCITNIVTVNDCANALLAAGASPTMAHHPQEMEDFAAVTDALVCNLGATQSVDAMLLAAAAAAKRGHPVVIDPVGCASSSFRRGICMKLVETVRTAKSPGEKPGQAGPDENGSLTPLKEGSSDGGELPQEGRPGKAAPPLLCIRGNAAEIRALAEHRNTGRGVDSPGALPEDAGRSGTGGVQDDGNGPGDAAPAIFSKGQDGPGQALRQTGQGGREAREPRLQAALFLARQTGAIVVQSGETDYVTDGRRIYAARGGSPYMARVTGTGCMLSSLMGAYLVAEPSALGAAACCARMNACAEEAFQKTAKEGGGTGTFRVRLIDALSGRVL